MTHTGTCLCGQTKVEIKGESPKEQIICHCTDCRETAGSAFGAAILVKLVDLKVEGPTKEFESKADSGKIVTRVFCSNCGGPIGHRSETFGDKQVVHTGIFKEFATLPIGAEVYVKDRWNGLPAIPGARQWNTMPATPRGPDQ